MNIHFLGYKEISYWGLNKMLAKMLLVWGILVVYLTTQAQSQYDPLGSDIYNIPQDQRRMDEIGENYERVQINPLADPLSIDSLMRPLDIEHTWEYLDKVSGRAYVSPYAIPEWDLRGNWQLELRDNALRQLALTLLQNREVIFGRGISSIGGPSQAAYSSGQTSKGVLYLDILSEDLILYRCALTISKDYLSGSYYAFDAQGRVWTGTAVGRRST
jgi:hypothetical protein